MKAGIGPETLSERLLRIGYMHDTALDSYLRSIKADGFDLVDLCCDLSQAARRCVWLQRHDAPLLMQERAGDDYALLADAVWALARITGINVEGVGLRHETQAAAV